MLLGLRVLRVPKVLLDLKVLKVLKVLRVPKVLLDLKVLKGILVEEVLRELKVLMVTLVALPLTTHLALRRLIVTQVQGNYYLIMQH